MSRRAHGFDDDASESGGDYCTGGSHSAGDSDFCSREGAHALKAKIEAYWRERGRSVMVALHNVGFHPAIRAARFDVRSDMVNGMPRVAGSVRRAAPVPIEESGDDDIVFE